MRGRRRPRLGVTGPGFDRRSGQGVSNGASPRCEADVELAGRADQIPHLGGGERRCAVIEGKSRGHAHPVRIRAPSPRSASHTGRTFTAVVLGVTSSVGFDPTRPPDSGPALGWGLRSGPGGGAGPGGGPGVGTGVPAAGVQEDSLRLVQRPLPCRLRGPRCVGGRRPAPGIPRCWGSGSRDAWPAGGATSDHPRQLPPASTRNRAPTGCPARAVTDERPWSVRSCGRIGESSASLKVFFRLSGHSCMS